MADVTKISTGKYTKEGKVNIDGHIWSIKLPGAGSELRLSQASRESKYLSALIDKLNGKIDDGSVTEDELARLEEYNDKFTATEKTVFGYFRKMLRDDTEDNSEVEAWLEETPMGIIQLAIEDVKKQANAEDTTPKAQDA